MASRVNPRADPRADPRAKPRVGAGVEARVDPAGDHRSLRAEHVAHTERRVIEAATDLFVERGYAATSMAAIADAAGVSARTVYVRFGSKAALFTRAVDVAVVGDVEHIALLDRSWLEPALGAASLIERVESWARVGRDVMSRIGRLIVVAQQASASDPAIADALAVGRRQSLEADRRFWGAAAADGLLDASIDVEWIALTASVLDSAETYVRLVEQLGWDLDDYEAWLARSLLALARVPSGGGAGAQ